MYHRDCGSEALKVASKYVTGFYELQDHLGEVAWCETPYRQKERRLYREEELSLTPWGEKKKKKQNEGAPPAYEPSPSPSSKPPGYDFPTHLGTSKGVGLMRKMDRYLAEK